jgi:RNA polymerase sigma-70 factor, ECF subfamily
MSDRQARFENLVNGYSDWLYRYAYWLCDERATAEDLVQETFLRAWRFLDSLKEEAAARSWLTTILRRENARKYERKQFDFDDVELDSLPEVPAGFDPRPESLALHSALRRLPLMCREPLLLQVLGGFTLDDIAEVFDLPSNTVATRLHRARQRLRMMLDPQGEGVGHELP